MCAKSISLRGCALEDDIASIESAGPRSFSLDKPHFSIDFTKAALNSARMVEYMRFPTGVLVSISMMIDDT
jgi:hypothetical protein